MEAPNHKHFRFDPTFSLGHMIQIVMFLVPGLVYCAVMWAKLNNHEEKINALSRQQQELNVTVALVNQNQAVLGALFEEHRRLSRLPEILSPSSTVGK